MSLIERGGTPLSGFSELNSGYWRRIEEAETASKNTLIEKFLLEDIEIAKKKEPFIAITFRIDLDGI